MTQEDKELIFKDLCGRLPYGVKILLFSIDYPYGEIVNLDISLLKDNYHKIGDDFKPYLRPMSDMTDEERKTFYDNRISHDGKMFESEGFDVDWLNEHMFDFRNLIENGLALEAPEGMYMSYDEKHPTTEDIIKKRDESIRKYGHFFKKKDE